jgi:hypothetical protein
MYMDRSGQRQPGHSGHAASPAKHLCSYIIKNEKCIYGMYITKPFYGNPASRMPGRPHHTRVGMTMTPGQQARMTVRTVVGRETAGSNGEKSCLRVKDQGMMTQRGTMIGVRMAQYGMRMGKVVEGHLMKMRARRAMRAKILSPLLIPPIPHKLTPPLRLPSGGLPMTQAKAVTVVRKGGERSRLKQGAQHLQRHKVLTLHIASFTKMGCIVGTKCRMFSVVFCWSFDLHGGLLFEVLVGGISPWFSAAPPIVLGRDLSWVSIQTVLSRTHFRGEMIYHSSLVDR